ncbi:MAG: ABC transporter permease [Bacteroidetes bacterium]|nr:ABC transporter permease [Bacteroidota bacterium]
MKFETFIARRYLASKRKVQFITIISFVSITGITVGVAALLIVLSVFNGFTGIVTSILVGFDPHIRIEQKGGIDLSSYKTIVSILSKEKSVTGYSPFISGKGMIISSTANKVVFIKGVDDEKVGEVSGVKEKIVLGKFELKESHDVGSIVLGLTLADRLGAIVGDEVAVVSPYAFSGAITPFSQPTTYRFKVAGIYESNNKEYDGHYAFISLAVAERIFEKQNIFTGIEVRLSNINQSYNVKAELLKKISGNIDIFTWYDLHADLYSMMQIERWVAYILLSLIILVASFNMLGSLMMTVIEKRRDIGVLQSMGATQKSIVKIFMFEGLLIGAVGTALGIGLGLLLIFLQQTYHLFPLDPSVYIIPAIPVEIHIIDFFTVAVASMLLSFIASYYPAKRASKIVPIESIRWE